MRAQTRVRSVQTNSGVRLLGCVTTPNISFIGFRGMSLSLPVLDRLIHLRNTRHPSKETMRIMADYVADVWTQCQVRSFL